MVSWWSRFSAYSRINAPCWCVDEAWWLWLLAYCYVLDAWCFADMGSYLPSSDNYLGCLWCALCMCTDWLEVYQCLFISITLWYGTLCIGYDHTDSHHGCNTSDAFSWFDDSLVLRMYRYDLSPCWNPWRTLSWWFDEGYSIPCSLLCSSRSC